MKFLDIHSHTQNSTEDTIVIKNQLPLEANTDELFSMGIHPWYFSEEDWQQQWQVLEEVARHPNCVAIGECGLDKNVSTDLELQMIVFQKHIFLSEVLQKPLIIHCVKAFGELVAVKKRQLPKQIWILHGFNKNKFVADMLLQNGIKLSFGSALLKNERLQEVFKSVPEGNYFFETDDDNLKVSQIYEKATKLKGKVKISNIFFGV